MSDSFFSVIFSGELQEGRTVMDARSALAALLKLDQNRIERLFSGSPVAVKRNMDFFTAVKLARLIRQAGGCCRIEVEKKPADVSQEGAGAAPAAGETAARAVVMVEKAKWLFEEVEKKLDWVKQLNQAYDQVKQEQSGSWGNKRLTLNVKLNEIWQERSEKINDLVKKEKVALRQDINKLKDQARLLDPNLQNSDFTALINNATVQDDDGTPLNRIFRTIQQAHDLIRRIELAAQVAGMNPSTGTPKSGCFIATAVYGSPHAPQVEAFRGYRDRVLSRYCLGRAFIRLYYITSPPVAGVLGRINFLKRPVRKILDRLLRIIMIRSGNSGGNNDR